MADTRIQTQFNIYQGRGIPGYNARPQQPSIVEAGIAGVAVRPGYGVTYNYSDQKWYLPTSDDDRKNVEGIVFMLPNSVPKSLSAIPAGSNSPDYTEFDAGDTIYVMKLLGVCFAVYGEAVKVKDKLEFDQTTLRWVKEPDTPRTGRRSIFEAEYPGAAGTIGDIRVWGM